MSEKVLNQDVSPRIHGKFLGELCYFLSLLQAQLVGKIKALLQTMGGLEQPPSVLRGKHDQALGKLLHQLSKKSTELRTPTTFTQRKLEGSFKGASSRGLNRRLKGSLRGGLMAFSTCVINYKGRPNSVSKNHINVRYQKTNPKLAP